MLTIIIVEVLSIAYNGACVRFTELKRSSCECASLPFPPLRQLSWNFLVSFSLHGSAVSRQLRRSTIYIPRFVYYAIGQRSQFTVSRLCVYSIGIRAESIS